MGDVQANVVRTAALDAGKITSGVLDSARIAAGSITAAKVDVGDFQSKVVRTADLDAGQIRTGFIDAARINVDTLKGKVLEGGVVRGGAIEGATITSGSDSNNRVVMGSDLRVYSGGKETVRLASQGALLVLNSANNVMTPVTSMVFGMKQGLIPNFRVPKVAQYADWFGPWGHGKAFDFVSPTDRMLCC